MQLVERIFAAGPIKPPSSVGILNAGSPGDINGALNPVLAAACVGLQWVFTAAIALSILLILWTAIQYMLAAGDKTKFELSHQRMLYIALGIGVAILARTIPVLINVIIGGKVNLAGIC